MDNKKPERHGTQMFDVNKARAAEIDSVMLEVNNALNEKGYSAVSQIVGYVMSGDPTYITSHKDARNLIQSIERDEILEEMVKRYLLSIQ